MSGVGAPTRERSPRVIEELTIYESKPWPFFDGASRESSTVSGAGGLLYISGSDILRFRAGPGSATSNLAELMAL